MTESELKEKASAICVLLRDEATPDEAIIQQILEFPELIHVKLLSGANLFLTAVLQNRFSVAMALADMGADIHWMSEASLIHGNALNAAHSPQQAEQLLDLGVPIERNLVLSKPLRNPAVAAAERNDRTMLFYWLKKQRELFVYDQDYIQALSYAVTDMVSTMNQPRTLACVMEDEELFPILKEIYSKVDEASSIRLYLNALGRIDDSGLEARKKELRKALNARKKELTSQA